MSLSGPPKIQPTPRPFTTEKVDSVPATQEKQREARDEVVAGRTVTPFRVKTKDLEMQTPQSAEAITTGTLAALSSTLGAVTVDADLKMSSTTTTRTIYWKASSSNYIQFANGALSMVVGTTSSDHLYLKRGSTTVMSFQGDSNTVTLAGDLDIDGTGVSTIDGDLKFASGKGVIFEGGDVDPTITAGAAKTEGAASTAPLGAIHIGVDGTLWTTYNDSGSSKWTAIHTHAND